MVPKTKKKLSVRGQAVRISSQTSDHGRPSEREGYYRTIGNPRPRPRNFVSVSTPEVQISIRLDDTEEDKSQQVLEALVEIRRTLVKLENSEAKTVLENGLRQLKTFADVSSLLETAYLLSSPRNAERLLSSLKRAGTVAPRALEEIEQELGLGKGQG
jgi:antitoxin YefM